jgi:hypothetical protein
MTALQQQILSLFTGYDPDVRDVVAAVLRIEQENIHMERPRVKEPILEVLDRVARSTLKEATDEN